MQCESCPSSNNCTQDDKEKCQMNGNSLSQIKKVIGIMSGKGGVGKSTISVLLASALQKNGNKVGILDADITGPSIPRLLGLQDKRAEVIEEGILPVTHASGLKVMSLNFLVDEEDQPVLWRGPLIGNMVKQFWTDVIWEELDYLIIDMPPGTGDVALTVMQSIPMEGIVMVSVPQDFVSMIVSKAIHMTRKMNIPVLGIIENMSYILCPDCGTKVQLFDGEVENFSSKMGVEILGELPMTKEIVELSQNGIHTISSEIQQTIHQIGTKIEGTMTHTA